MSAGLQQRYLGNPCGNSVCSGLAWRTLWSWYRATVCRSGGWKSCSPEPGCRLADVEAVELPIQSVTPPSRGYHRSSVFLPLQNTLGALTNAIPRRESQLHWENLS